MPGHRSPGAQQVAPDVAPQGAEGGRVVIGQVVVGERPGLDRCGCGGDGRPARVAGGGEVGPGAEHAPGERAVAFVGDAADEELCAGSVQVAESEGDVRGVPGPGVLRLNEIDRPSEAPMTVTTTK